MHCNMFLPDARRTGWPVEQQAIVLSELGQRLAAQMHGQQGLLARQHGTGDEGGEEIRLDLLVFVEAYI